MPAKEGGLSRARLLAQSKVKEASHQSCNGLWSGWASAGRRMT